MTEEQAWQGTLGTITQKERRLSRPGFPGARWDAFRARVFINLDNPLTRQAYRMDVKEFTRFAGVEKTEEMRAVTRADLSAFGSALRRYAL